jgi:ABC-type uncharacterized transport system ATPase subunit
MPREDQFGVDLEASRFEVRAGEVVGIAGVSGNGQKELLYALSGEDTRRRRAGRSAWTGPTCQPCIRARRRKLGSAFCA